jgi:hypothetical protein
MMQLRISTHHQVPGALSNGLPVLYQDDLISIEGEGLEAGRDADGRHWFLGGVPPGAAAAAIPDILEGRREGRFLALVQREGTWEVHPDPFGQRDLYFGRLDGTWVCGTDLSLVTPGERPTAFNQVALAHTLGIYGNRPAKRDTLYTGIERVPVDSFLRVSASGMEVVSRPFTPAEAGGSPAAHLNDYADALLEAIRARGSSDGNLVYLSSGWDSTAILACLVQQFGKKNVRAVIGRMRYAHRSGVINQFEIDRARAMAEYYGITLEQVELDYRDDVRPLVDELRPLFRRNQLANLTGVNHARLAAGARALGAASEPIFAGEISDGAHNLGFSQFVSILHPVLEFREYADKMSSYLFGPTFLDSLCAGTHERDLIYQWLRPLKGDMSHEAPEPDPKRRAGQLLSSFFLRNQRFPLASVDNLAVLTPEGRALYQRTMFDRYLSEAATASSSTLYAWYLRLYNSFHWQGATVASLALTADAEGLHTELPFWDRRLQDVLSAMPEGMGRGLNLNPTKYPLKWTLMNRVDYPMHLQTGPHSYLYDVDSSFSHTAEILYASGFVPVFREALADRSYRDVCAPDVFDLEYLDGLVGEYLSGEQAQGQRMADLLNLAVLSMVGWYGVE